MPIIPETWKYVVHQNKKAQFNILKGLANRKDVENLVCATDAEHEGELITYLRTDSRYLISDMAQGLPGIAVSAASFIHAITKSQNH